MTDFKSHCTVSSSSHSDDVEGAGGDGLDGSGRGNRGCCAESQRR